MLSSQLKLNLSYYSDLYDRIIPKDHILRKINEIVDFSFVYEELESKYCLNNGRCAKSPILLFKYLFLKYFYNLSDQGVVERSRYDMSFKYFLGLSPEEEVIHPSLLTKFRKQRLKDENLLDLLIGKSVEIAIEQGVLKSNTIIVDSEEYQKYCNELIKTAEESPVFEVPAIKEESTLLAEMLDNQVDCYDQSPDPDARVGHKTLTSSFYGYKTHLAMTEDRIITAATVTSGEAFDGTELPVLVQKSKDAGVPVDEVIADTAYSTLENLKDAETEKYGLISRLNPRIVKGTRSEDGFVFNKDAGTMQCPAGNLAVKQTKEKRKGTKKNARIKYLFDISKCKTCPHRNGCYKEGAKSKTYCVTTKSDYHKSQEAFQKTEYFKERVKVRYMIEAKNSELKNVHGFDRCDSAGLASFQLQGAVSIFAVNLKRIIRLMGEVCPND